MQLTRDDIKMMYELHSNVKTLLKLQTNNAVEKLLTYEEAGELIGRKRRWLQNRVVAEGEAIPKNTDGKLFFELDYVRFGNQLRFRQSSIEKLKMFEISQS